MSLTDDDLKLTVTLKGSLITVFITLLLFFKFKAHVILNNRHDSDSDN